VHHQRAIESTTDQRVVILCRLPVAAKQQATLVDGLGVCVVVLARLDIVRQIQGQWGGWGEGGAWKWLVDYRPSNIRVSR
jgi:hypothetical protein